MKLVTKPVSSAHGTVLAHSVRLENGCRLRKGVLLELQHIEKLTASKIDEVIVAVLEETDIREDAAADRLAEMIGTAGVDVERATTGRVNFYASHDGLFVVSPETINAINRIDPGITIATLENNAEVNQGRMIATIKIIPYAVAARTFEKLDGLELEAVFSVLPFKPMRVGLIQTELPTMKPATLDKTRRVLERRLQRSGSGIVREIRTAHQSDEIAAAIGQLEKQADMLILFGASAICDLGDVIPQAIEAAGGEVLRFGMPVDPGNLLLLARKGAIPVLGAPGCARSPAENGFDWVLSRLLAGLEITAEELAGMGVGGLLMETGSRPHPRELPLSQPGKIAGIILAAGQSRRMGRENKLTVDFSGKPLLRHVAEAAAASRLDDMLVVTGHESEAVANLVEGLSCKLVHNPDFESGLASSLKAGITALGQEVGHAMILLGDMPFVTSQMIDQMLVAAQGAADNAIIMATHNGKRGNPVVWPRRYFNELLSIEGDTGARHLIGHYQEHVFEVELGEAASLDLDTPEALAAARHLKCD